MHTSSMVIIHSKNYLSIIPDFNASRVLIHTSISCPETVLGLLLRLSSHVTPVILNSEDNVSEHKKECRCIIIDLNLSAFDGEK